MESDLAVSLIAARTAGTQNTVQLAVLKKSHEMEMSLIDMVDQQVRAAPPAGQGTKVDKIA